MNAIVDCTPGGLSSHLNPFSLPFALYPGDYLDFLEEDWTCDALHIADHAYHTGSGIELSLAFDRTRDNEINSHHRFRSPACIDVAFHIDAARTARDFNAPPFLKG